LRNNPSEPGGVNVKRFPKDCDSPGSGAHVKSRFKLQAIKIALTQSSMLKTKEC